MTSSPDNTVAEILYEFLGQFKEDDYLAQDNTDNTVESLDSHYLSIFLDLVGEDENMLEELDNLGVAHKLDKPAYTTFMLARNALRQELRTALQDRLGEK